MENGWSLFNFTNTATTSFGGGHNSSNCTTTAWDIWESGTGSTSKIDWSGVNPHDSFTSNTTVSSSATATVTTHEESAAAVQALMFAHQANHDHVHHSSSTPSRFYCGGGGGGRGSHFFRDPHLMCLKLGKRHYFGDAIATPLGDRRTTAAAYSITKKGKPYYVDAGGDTGLLGPSTSAGVTVASPAAVPRCQVDGCNVVLLNAKDYHRRHKVCETHSKAPKVMVLGLEQRFCQQCSRFHAVSEFDESKRSCRRRLAGHNERRRKTSQEHSGIRNQSHVNSKLMTYPGRHPYLPLNGALSLLSSKNDSWISATDLPTRCSAALRELIAENRAAILARQLILDKEWHWHHHPAEDLNGCQSGSNSILNYQEQTATGSHNWERMGEADAHVTLDLMQAPNSAFGFLSVRGKSKEDDQECSELWSSYGGAHVV